MSFQTHIMPNENTHEKRFNSIIQTGRAAATKVLDHIASTRIEDKLAKAHALRFFPTEDRIAWKLSETASIPTDIPGTDVMVDIPGYGIHPNALGQLSSQAGIPGDYVRKMSSDGEAWKRELIANVMNEHFQHTDPDKRLLLRCVGNELRGAVSDKYKILRSEPLFDTFALAAQRHGAVPSGGYISAVRIGLRAIHPEPFYINPKNALCLGVQLRHSDFGKSSVELSLFVFRSTCLNTIVLKNAMSMRHLGRKMEDTLALSERTIHLNTMAAASEIADIVDQAMAPECKATIQAQLSEANDHVVEFSSYQERVEKALGKGLCAKVEEMFNGEDVVNVPPDKTLWRLSNAVSWAAHDMKDADKAVDMERFAGQLLPGG